MKSNLVIQRILCFGLVLLFLFSITPKKYLHDLVAKHTDTYSHAAGKETHFTQKGFNCHVDDLVVKAPFIEDLQRSAVSFPPVYPQYLQVYCLSHFYNNLEAKDSRGPPAVL